jgi:hypothetical protein
MRKEKTRINRTKIENKKENKTKQKKEKEEGRKDEKDYRPLGDPSGRDFKVRS